MKFTIQIIDTDNQFQVVVFDGDKEVYRCEGAGGNFRDGGAQYVVLSPYHDLNNGQFRVYELVPVSEPTTGFHVHAILLNQLSQLALGTSEEQGK